MGEESLFLGYRGWLGFLCRLYRQGRKSSLHTRKRNTRSRHPSWFASWASWTQHILCLCSCREVQKSSLRRPCGGSWRCRQWCRDWVDRFLERSWEGWLRFLYDLGGWWFSTTCWLGRFVSTCSHRRFRRLFPHVWRYPCRKPRSIWWWQRSQAICVSAPFDLWKPCLGGEATENGASPAMNVYNNVNGATATRENTPSRV